MKPAELKQALADGQPVFGTMVFEFNTPGVGLIAAEAGASFVLFDMEHTGWSIESIRAQMAWSRSHASCGYRRRSTTTSVGRWMSEHRR
jgi:2-dehydro-3-deoxyglucarate aldolase/4-hydroxy-2-oxoheptanedioate aldolase